MGFDEQTARSAVGTLKYGMLLDSSANAIGTVTNDVDYWQGFSMTLSDYGKNMDPSLIEAFSATLPENFDGSLNAEGLAEEGETISAKVPAGIYDYIIAEQIGAAGSEHFGTASNYGEQAGYGKDFLIEKGKIYHFTVSVEVKNTSVMGNYAVPVVTLTVSDCDHRDAEHVDAKAATEKEEGNIEYWFCPDCGKYFKNADLTEEVSYEQTVIPAKGSEVKPDDPKNPENPSNPEEPSKPENPSAPETSSDAKDNGQSGNSQDKDGTDGGQGNTGSNGTAEDQNQNTQNASQAVSTQTSAKTSDSVVAEVSLILLLIGCACSAAAYRRRRR